MEDELRLMIVDDNPHARNALSAYISTRDWLKVIDDASDGEEAIRKIEIQIPNIILMDAQMPVMDGLQATHIIKKRWPQIKIIIFTLYPDYQARAKQEGADAFFVKGCPMEEMISAIRNLTHTTTCEK